MMWIIATEGRTGTEVKDAGFVSKVSVICDAILAVLLAHYPTTHFQSVITAHMSKIPPDIASALNVIAKLKGILFKAFTHVRR